MSLARQLPALPKYILTKTKGKPTHPYNPEKAGIEEEDDEYAGPSSLQYDVFHDGGRGE